MAPVPESMASGSPIVVMTLLAAVSVAVLASLLSIVVMCACGKKSKRNDAGASALGDNDGQPQFDVLPVARAPGTAAVDESKPADTPDAQVDESMGTAKSYNTVDASMRSTAEAVRTAPSLRMTSMLEGKGVASGQPKPQWVNMRPHDGGARNLELMSVAMQSVSMQKSEHVSIGGESKSAIVSRSNRPSMIVGEATSVRSVTVKN